MRLRSEAWLFGRRKTLLVVMGGDGGCRWWSRRDDLDLQGYLDYPTLDELQAKQLNIEQVTV